MNSVTEMVNAIAELWAGQMWTIIWQSSVLAGLVVIVTLLFRRLSAAVKFWLWMLVPLRLLVMPLITVSLPLLPAITPSHIENLETSPAIVKTAAVEYSPTMMENFSIPDEALNFAPIKTPPIGIQEQKAEPNKVLIKPNLLTFIMILWFAGVVFWTVRLFWSWRNVRHIVHNAIKSDRKNLIEHASKAAAIVGLKKIPEILVTHENISPFLFGIFRPVLIIPSGFVNNVNEEGLAAVFSHEFAHLRRKDTLVGWILAICEAFYFFYPVLHFAKRRILFERERACDDWVIASGNSHKKTYANALIDAAGICRKFSTRLGPTGVVAESFGDLKKRIIAISSNLKPKTRLSKATLVLLILIGTICVPGFVLTNRTIASSEHPGELLEKLKSLDELYTSELTLTGTDIRVPDYPDVPRQKIRWKISMHQDEFALEQISDEIYELKSNQPVNGLLVTPSMMMKAVVYMSKQRGGHHYIFGKVLEPGKALEPEDNMIGGQVLINKTNPDYFIVSKIRYLWSIGRYYSKYIDKIVEVSTDNNGILTVTAVGQGTSKIPGKWELKINPAAMYMVQEAKFTRFDSEGELSETPEIIINNSGVKWFDKLCIPQETSFTGLGNNVNVPIIYEKISPKADLEFIKQANEFLDPPYKVQTSYSIRSGSGSIIFDSIYEPDEETAEVKSLSIISEKFTTTLPNGVTVELVGVSGQIGEEKQWWKPDGTTLDFTPYEKPNRIRDVNDSNKVREFAIEFGGSYSGDARHLVYGLDGEKQSNTSVRLNYVSNNLRAITAIFSKDKKSTTVPLLVTAGDWETRVVSDGRHEIKSNLFEGEAIFRDAAEENGKSHISIVDNGVVLDEVGRVRFDSRIVAIDTKGNVIIGKDITKALRGRSRVYDYEFEKPLGDIAFFEFQTRPYYKVEFENVALELGENTDVVVKNNISGSRHLTEIQNVETSTVTPPVWVSYLPASPIRSLADYQHSQGVQSITSENIKTCELEIRLASDNKRIAKITYNNYPMSGSRMGCKLNKNQIQEIGAIKDGTYSAAIYVNGIRSSNVAEFTIDSNADLSSEPVLKLIPLSLGPRQVLPNLGIVATGPNPTDSQLEESAIYFPNLFVDGIERKPKAMIWNGSDRVIQAGMQSVAIIDLENYTPVIELNEPHEVWAKLGKHQSATVVIPASDTTDKNWDGITEKFYPATPPVVMLEGTILGPDGKPAAYNISINRKNENSISTMSGLDGKYKFTNLPVGEYILFCSPPLLGRPGFLVSNIQIRGGIKKS